MSADHSSTSTQTVFGVTLRRAIGLLTSHERNRAILLLLLMMVVGLLESCVVAAVLPFVYVLVDPQRAASIPMLSDLLQAAGLTLTTALPVLSAGLILLLSAFRYGWMNPWWAHQTNEKGKPAPLFAEALTQRSQDLPPLLCPTGAIWMADVVALKKSASFYGPGFEFFLIVWFAAVDIDDQEDFDMARAIFQMNKQRRHA